VFFPITSLHELLQPIAQALPLSVVVSGLRGISNDGASLLALNSTALGLVVWMAISFFVAVKYFVWKEVAN
jgi:ABC-type multidrug transport system permease subunit